MPTKESVCTEKLDVVKGIHQRKNRGTCWITKLVVKSLVCENSENIIRFDGKNGTIYARTFISSMTELLLAIGFSSYHFIGYRCDQLMDWLDLAIDDRAHCLS